MGKLNHAQLRDIEQLFIDNDPYAIPDDDEEVTSNASQETSHT